MATFWARFGEKWLLLIPTSGHSVGNVLTGVVEVHPARLVEHQVLHGQVGQHHAEDGDEEVGLDRDAILGLGRNIAVIIVDSVTLSVAVNVAFSVVVSRHVLWLS